MKAIELASYGGIDSLRLIDTEQPKPTANQILIQVRAAGINLAELELAKGDYRVPKTPPFIMGFEAAGVVMEVGSQVQHVKVGDPRFSAAWLFCWAFSDLGRVSRWQSFC
jgi:NADPH2:quinone reductase